MTELEIKQLIKAQRAYFQTGITLSVEHRLLALRKLKACILAHEEEIHVALRHDLGKSSFEGYMCETGLVLSELSHMIKYCKQYAKEKTVLTPLAQFPSRSYKKPSPYGVTLIMSPWNYPFMLTMEPLIDAIAAGNTAVLKPSAYSPATSLIIQKIIKKCFPFEYVSVVPGGRTENSYLLAEHFDYIFFTGSPIVGREVMRHASETLTPVTLELGGKSPCIVEKTANLKLAAKRIVFGKFLNCGQTCVAPDYIYCDRSIQKALIEELIKEIKKQFGDHPFSNQNYGKIINTKHFHRLASLIDPTKVVHGGAINESTLQIEPTIVQNITWNDPVMKEEIFGPILPVVSYDSLNEAIQTIQSMPHPLAFYFFTSNKSLAKKVMAYCGFGGGCINDVVIHLATSEMGFGGFGESGMGSYHGKAGFDTFSHVKSIVDKKTWLDLPIRYQPYNRFYKKLLKLFLK